MHISRAKVLDLKKLRKAQKRKKAKNKKKRNLRSSASPRLRRTVSKVRARKPTRSVSQASMSFIPLSPGRKRNHTRAVKERSHSTSSIGSSRTSIVKSPMTDRKDSGVHQLLSERKERLRSDTSRAESQSRSFPELAILQMDGSPDQNSTRRREKTMGSLTSRPSLYHSADQEDDDTIMFRSFIDKGREFSEIKKKLKNKEIIFRSSIEKKLFWRCGDIVPIRVDVKNLTKKEFKTVEVYLKVTTWKVTRDGGKKRKSSNRAGKARAEISDPSAARIVQELNFKLPEINFEVPPGIDVTHDIVVCFPLKQRISFLSCILVPIPLHVRPAKK